MLKRALPLLLVLGCPAVVVSQISSIPPRPAAPAEEVGPIAALAEEQQQSVEELQRLIVSRDALTKEIQRLREITGQHQQVVTSVKVYELSLNKARKANINVEGVKSEWLHDSGFGGALSAGVFDNSGQAEDARQVRSGTEIVHTRVIENDEVLKKAVAELKKAGALRVLAEPTLATTSGRPASLNIGGEFPVPVPRSNGGSTIQFKEFGTRLDLVPVVLGHGRIQLELRPRISEIDVDRSVVLGDLTVPGLRTRSVDTAVEMSVGQTYVLAGLVQRRAIHKALDVSVEADMNRSSELVPSTTSQGNDVRGQDETEATELIVVVRAEVLDTPKVARRTAVGQ
ncbi:MAG: hypothetical protein R3E01_04835 [Pirellulaceae bacterium]